MQSLSEYPEKLNSLGEVQRIIGLSLSKIQLGRNQRGGLPLHKNLLVATVLNKARDLYMQETMYMNYKMMTGHQFGMPASAEGTSSLTRFSGNVSSREEDMDESPEQEDYEEDSESDVEDDCEQKACDMAAASPRSAAIAASMAYPASTMAAMMMQAAAASVAASSCAANETGRLTPITPSAITMQNKVRLHHQQQSGEVQPEEQSSSNHDGSFSMHGSFQHLHHLSQLHHHHQQQQQQQQLLQQQQQHQQQLLQQQQQHQEQQQQQQSAAMAAVRVQAAGNDEGFIDEPDCDCDVRNFSTLETRVPFQYCYHCAPFQSANGRGPTLVPSPTSCPSMPPIHSRQVSDDNDGLSPMTSHNQNSSGFQSSRPSCSVSENNFTIYDLDSKSTERKSPCDELSRHGTKRRRKGLDVDNHEMPKKRRPLEVAELDVVTPDDQPETSSENANNKREENESFHPAFRNESGCGVPHTMEMDQITSLVSIFSFGQHIIAAGNNKDNVSTTTTTTCDSILTSPDTEAGGSLEKKSSEDDSDSESDTSSDSGHSSDDHDLSSDKEATKEEDSAEMSKLTKLDPSEMSKLTKLDHSEMSKLTKLTRSVSTPDLCSASVTDPVISSDSQICIEVASV